VTARARGGGLALAWLLCATSCSAPPAPQGTAAFNRPLVVATLPPLAWFVERIAGDRVELVTLLPNAASPELYEPALAQLAALDRANLVVEVGHPHLAFERAWLDPVLDDRTDLTRVSFWDGEAAHAHEPHVWLSPLRALPGVARLIDALARQLADPEAAAALRQQGVGLLREMRQLDLDLRSQLAPFRGRTFVVFHPAWEAFAEDYGLEQVAVEHDHKTPGPRELARVIERARDAGVRYVFAQPQFDRAPAVLVAAEVGVEVELLDPFARDWNEGLRRTGRMLAADFAQ